MAFSSSPIATATTTGVGGGTTSSVNTSGADFLVVSVAWYSNPTSAVTVSDSNGNTYTPLTKQETSGFVAQQLFYCEAPTVGSGHTFTVAGTTIYAGMVATAWSGSLAPTSYHSQNGASQATVVPSLSTGSVTPPENQCLVVAGFTFSTPGAVTASNSYTIAAQVNHNASTNEGVALAYLVQGAAAATSTAFTSSSADGAAAAIAVFRTAAVGGGSAKSGARSISKLNIGHTIYSTRN